MSLWLRILLFRTQSITGKGIDVCCISYISANEVLQEKVLMRIAYLYFSAHEVLREKFWCVLRFLLFRTRSATEKELHFYTIL